MRAHFGMEPFRTEPHHCKWYGYELEILTGQDALQAGVGWFTNYYLDDKPYMIIGVYSGKLTLMIRYSEKGFIPISKKVLWPASPR